MAGFLEKTVILRETESNRKRGGLNRGWIDFIKEAVGPSLLDLSRL